ncbi:F-box protein [Legionella sp. WA2022007384]
MLFDQLPLEMKTKILEKLNTFDLQKTAQVSIDLRSESLRLLQTTNKDYPVIKKLPNTTSYYAVGEKVNVCQSSNPWDKTFPYQKKRETIPAKEIEAAIPKTEKMKLFRTQKEAQEYATLTLEESHSVVNRIAAVFQVQLKESFEGIVTKQLVTPALYHTYRMGPSKTAIEYVLGDVSNLEFISGQVSNYQPVALNDKKEESCACLLM